MPTYEYQCEECGERFSRWESMADHGATPPSCPKCESKRTIQVPSSFYAKTVKKS